MCGAEAKLKSVTYSHDWQRLEFRTGTCGSSRRVSSSSRECWEATLAGVANAPPLGVPKLPLALGRWGVRLASSAEPCSAGRPHSSHLVRQVQQPPGSFSHTGGLVSSCISTAAITVAVTWTNKQYPVLQAWRYERMV